MEIIKEILAKGQQGLSPVSTKKVCGCGKEYVYWEYPGPNKVIKGIELCRDCQEKERAKQRKVELEKELAKIIVEDVDWWEDSHIPAYFFDKTFATFDRKIQPKAFDVVKNLHWQISEDLTQGQSLVLLSPALYGVGKTHLVCALVNEIIETEDKAVICGERIVKHRCPVYFTTENELLRRIRTTYDHKDGGETEEGIYRQLSHVDLLIIDDVGKVRPKDLSFLQGVYFNIIDQRYSDSQPIILTTNLDYDQLEEHIGGACADRLREMAGKNFIKMTGTSYRQKAKDVSAKP